MLKKNLANIITAVRIIGTIILWFLPIRDTSFLICYGICGLSDVVDGFVARSLKIQSKFGSRLDSFADLFFYATMLFRIFARLIEVLPGQIWYFVGLTCLIRIIDYSYTALKFHHLAAMHTILNKLTGAMIFFLPVLLETGLTMTIYSCCLCAIALIAAVQEIILHIRLKPEMSNEA